MEYEWKVKIYENPQKMDFDFYIISNTPGDVRAYVSDAKNGIMKYLKEGDAMEGPSFTLKESMMKALFYALQEKGMKPKEQSYVEWKLEAVENHLRDMRDLVFGDRHIINIEKKSCD